MIPIILIEFIFIVIILNATFQNLNFTSVSQPLYAIITADEQLLNKPVGYTPNATEFKEWLECGVQAGKK